MPCLKAPPVPVEPLVATVTLDHDAYLRALFEIAEFLGSDEATGVYRIKALRQPSVYAIEYRFSDPDTAFAMKMKFG